MKHVVTAARGRQSLLVTGFGAFPGQRQNPTTAMLAELERHRVRLGRLGIDVHGLALPVVYGEIERVLRQAVATCRPDAILHLGLAGRRATISVEMRALNRAGPLHPDAAGRRPDHQVLVSGAPSRLAATYPAAQIVAALRRRGLPAHRSIDAGDYVCNATLFRALAGRLAPQIGFLHVPRPTSRAQPQARTRRRRPSQADLGRAMLLALMVMARQTSTGRPFLGPRSHRMISAASRITAAAAAAAISSA